MKVVFIAPQNSIHVIRWANAVVEKVEELHLITLHPTRHNLSEKVKVHKLKFKAPIGYISNSFELKKLINKINPDIVHIHQLSGHGTLMSLTGIKGYLLSVYGSDIYNFPRKTVFHKGLIKYNLRRASFLASTSNVMAEEIRKYTKKEIFVTPFGVDINKLKKLNSIFSKRKTVTIGLVKTLKKKYGIEYLIRAVPILEKKLQDFKIHLIVYGEGELKSHLKDLSNSLKISAEFPGYINNELLPEVINQFDIVCIPSNNESFGVSAVEAMACERPLVVTNADGLKEVVDDNINGIIVEKMNPYSIAEGLYKLIKNKDLSLEMGRNGREKVLNKYNWEDNVDQMLKIYKRMLNS